MVEREGGREGGRERWGEGEERRREVRERCIVGWRNVEREERDDKRKFSHWTRLLIHHLLCRNDPSCLPE